MDGRQQQDQQPPRRGGRAFPSPQPYQTRRRQDQASDRGEHSQPAQPQPSRGAAPGGRGGGRHSGGGRRAQLHGLPRQAPSGAGEPVQAIQVQQRPVQPATPAAAPAAPMSVQDLVALAGDARQAVASRAGALQQLHQLLFDPAAQRQALQQLQTLWPRLLALLYDSPDPAITAAAAPAVGAIGALAAQAAAAAAAAARAAASAGPAAAASPAAGTSASGLLFDWLLPVLQQRASPAGRALEQHQLTAVLLALRDCLSGVDAVTLARYANAVLAACQALLEGEATPPALLAPLLAVVQQAARHQHSIRPRFQDLVDLLLGWALEPALPDAARPALSRTLAAFGAQWRQQPAFTATLLGNLLADMARLADKATAEAADAAANGSTAAAEGTAGSPTLRQLLALAACVLPMLDAAAAMQLATCCSHLRRFLQVCKQVAAAAAAGAVSPAAALLAAVELSAHVSRLAALAPAAVTAEMSGSSSSAAPGQQQEPRTPMPPAEKEYVVVQLVASMQALSLAEEHPGGGSDRVHLRLAIQPLTAAAEPSAAAAAPRAAAADSLLQLFAAAAAFAGAALSAPSTVAQPATALSALAAVRAWLQLLVQQQAGGLAVQLDAAAQVLLPAPSSSLTAGITDGSWLLSLRAYSSKEVVLQVAQLLALLLPHSPAALSAVLADTAAQAAGLVASAAEKSAVGGHETVPLAAAGGGPAGADAAALLLFNVRLLKAALPQLPAASLNAIWQCLLPVAAEGLLTAGSQQQTLLLQVRQDLLRLLSSTGQRLVDGHRQFSVADDSIAALSQLLSSSCPPEPAMLAALHWLRQAAEWLAQSEVLAAETGAVSPTGTGSPASSDSCCAALSAALACTDATSAAVRAAALGAASALASGSRGAAVLLADAGAAGRVYQSALLHLGDLHIEVAAAARQLLEAAAAPLALAAAIGPAGRSARSGASAIAAAQVAVEAALGQQHLGFRPMQLQQLLTFLSSPDAPTAVLTAGGQQQAAPLRHWLPRLLLSMRAVPPPIDGSTACDPQGRPWQAPTCLSLAAWCAVQEAAKQCVAARLRTHHGGPAQTLAALEHALHAAAGRLQQEQVPSLVGLEQSHSKGGSASSISQQQLAAVLLLLFLHALEQGIASAGSGCTSRADAPHTAAAFFAANSKVCQAWFARVRPTMVRAAAAAQLHELTAYHALQRLRDLQQQAQSLLPSAPAATAGTAADRSSDSAAKGSPAAVVAAAREGVGTGQDEAPSPASPAPGQSLLAGRKASGFAAVEDTGGAANPAAALLAATRGSPDLAPLGSQSGEPASPAAAAQRSRLAQQRAQQLAAKVAEGAAAAATALCALRDADGIAGLQAFCRRSFQPLLHMLHSQQAADRTPATEGAQPTAADDTAAAAAAAAAWDWLSAAGQQAAGQHESAVCQYSKLSSAPGSIGQQCVSGSSLARLVADAYTAVGDADGLAAWLQTKPGSRLPPATAQRALRLASWDLTASPPVQPADDHAGSICKLLGRLELASLEPAASSVVSSGAALPAQAGLLAELAVASSEARQAKPLLQLPAELLLSEVATGATGRSRQPFTAWQLAQEQGPDVAVTATMAAYGAGSLQPLQHLLRDQDLLDGQRAVLLLAAAQAAAASSNAACAARFRVAAGAAISATSMGEKGAIAEAMQLMLHMQELQAAPAGQDRSLKAWQLLQSALHTKLAASVVPAAALLLLADPRPPAGILPAEAGKLAMAADARLGSDAVPMQRLEQLLVQSAAKEQGRVAAEAASLHYAALKAAVASAPRSASQWWQWAAWLHCFAEHQQQQEQQTAAGEAVMQATWAASFAASCQALIHGSSSVVGGITDGFSALPVLLQVLQMVGQQDSADRLPADSGAQLAAVPAGTWLPVVPQLISALAAADGSGSSSAELQLSFLQHIGGAAPCQVLLPALVASAKAVAPAHTGGAAAGSPLSLLVQRLQREHPRLAQQLSVLVAEAARLAVLPEEHWQAVLQEAAATAAKRLQAQQRAAKSAAAADAADGADSAGSGAGSSHGAPAGGCLEEGSSYWAALGPVLLPLQQQLEAAEAAPPQTPHERRFQQRWLPRLRRLLQQLTEPLAGTPGHPTAGAGPASAASEQQRLHQRSVALLRAAASELAAALRAKQLSLCDVAPALAELSDTGIPIPGAVPAASGDAAGGSAPTLACVAGEVAVLATKTRPKRLRLTASDGSQHSFLLKGREDLRAEARLMQLLRACHAALQHPSAGREGGLAVHCFEVTPLGPRLGLVQWVEDAAPLYEIYTAWQQGRAQRQQLLATAAADAGGSRQAPARQQQQLRPAEFFYAKLKEAGIDPASPRDAWPQDRLARAFAGMEKSVDRQLLWRELWAGSAGAADWWQRQRAFAASAAAMSMVGHLLGLGDRHLDNILLHRRGAHLVHIDFSVVFDRGLHLKVPEVVPFRLTQTLVEALGVTGVEGGFRRGCERALGTLRANMGPLCALLEACLLDPGVDWEAEALAKVSNQAFAQALALRAFALRAAAVAAPLAAAADSARTALDAASAALGAYVQQFLAAAGTAAAAAESHALLQWCETTLGSAAAQEQRLVAEAQEGRAALDRMLVEAQPLAEQLQACLEECRAWQQRHSALLPLLVVSPPAALVAGPAAIDPAAAAAAGMSPLLLVTGHVGSGGLSSDTGAGSIVHVSLGVPPSHTPLSASLLLQAAAVDQQGQRLLRERAAAAQQLAGALQQYAAAAACLLGGVGYAGSTQHAHWLAAFQAAMDLPIPQGFERATELAPRRRDAAAATAAWRPLAAAAAAAVGLTQQLGSTSAALQLERVDVALAAADAKQRAVGAAESAWSTAAGATSAGSREAAAAALARAFAAFSEQEAANVLQLAAEHEEQAEQAQQAAQEGADEAAGEAAPAAALEGVQRLILGYASMAVAVRDATSEELFLASDGSNLLGWLSQAVQAADSLSTAAAELQLLLPPLMALLHSPAAAERVAAAVAAAAAQLEAANDAGEQAGAAAAEERAAAAAMQPLMMTAAQHPAVAALLQSLQAVQSASQLLLPPEEQPSLARQQLLLAGALVALWQELEEAAAAAEEQEAAAALLPWQRCSTALAAAVAEEVAQHLLAPLADALGATGLQLRAAAASLAHRAGLHAAVPAEGPAGRALGGPPDLVPFTDFDAELPGADMLLGGLEDELEAGGSHEQGQGGTQPAELAARQPGDAAGSQPPLVPFLDFDESLAGTEELLELEGPGAFYGAPGGSQEAMPWPSASLSKPLEEEAAKAEPGSSSSAAQAEARQHPALLAAAAEACGALAAVDAVQYVSALALQQCQQLRQRHCGELAAFQWRNEHVLPPAATDAAASLLAGAGLELSAAALSAAGAPLPTIHPAVAAWSLRSSRTELLQALAAGAGTLQALEAPLQQWRAQLASVAAQMAAEVDVAAPYASSALQHQLQHQQQWLQQAAGVAASLLELSQAVLQLEAACTADADAPPLPRGAEDSPGAQQEPAGVASAAEQYQAEQREGWQRYEALLRQMQQLQGEYSATQQRVQASDAELEQLRLRQLEAAAIKQSAEVAGSNAAANFAALALPLVKATQQLPQAVTRLLPMLAGARECAAQLAAARRAAAELAATECGEGSPAAALAAEAKQAAARLASSAACLRGLPAAVETLQAALLPARNRLLAGGRGETAAQAQAAQVVDALSAAATQLNSQLEHVPQVQGWLAGVPSDLQALAARADEAASALQRQHGFTLRGIVGLLQAAEPSPAEAGAAEGGPAAAAAAAPAFGAALTGSLLVTNAAVATAHRDSGVRLQHAKSVLARVRDKLSGQSHARGSGETTPADVAAEVQRLIEAATDRFNLAKMYEGWMPWV